MYKVLFRRSLSRAASYRRSFGLGPDSPERFLLELLGITQAGLFRTVAALVSSTVLTLVGRQQKFVDAGSPEGMNKSLGSYSLANAALPKSADSRENFAGNEGLTASGINQESN